MALEIRLAGGSRKWDDVANIRHSGHELHDAFEAESEASVGYAAETAQIEIPPIVVEIEPLASNRLFQDSSAMFALRAPDDFANSSEASKEGAVQVSGRIFG